MLERALAVGEKWDLSLQFHVTASRLGAAYALAGRVDEGVRLLERAIEHATSWGLINESSLRATWLGEAHLLAGRIADALPLALHALDLARRRGERGYQAWALRLLGEIGRRRDRPDIERAEADYRQALALAEELGMRPLQAHCHHGLGSLYRVVGRIEEARAGLSAAVELYRAMDMTFWLPGAEAELNEVTRAGRALAPAPGASPASG